MIVAVRFIAIISITALLLITVAIIFECGTPVRTATMARKLRELAGAIDDMGPRVLNMASPNCIKCWGYKWRRRNGGKIGMLRKSEPAGRDQALAKASPPLVAPHLPASPVPASPPTGLPLPSP